MLKSMMGSEKPNKNVNAEQPAKDPDAKNEKRLSLFAWVLLLFIIVVGLWYLIRLGQHLGCFEWVPEWLFLDSGLSAPVATLLASSGVIIAASIAFWNGEETRREERDKWAESRQQETVRSLRDRYFNITELLSGNSNYAQREAAVYSLVALSDDWAGLYGHGTEAAVREQQTCLNVIVGQLRDPFPEEDDYEKSRKGSELIVFKQRVQGLITQRYRYSGLARRGEWSHLDLDLSFCHLYEPDFSRCAFATKALFNSANVTGTTNFNSAKFTGTTDFRGVTFDGTTKFNYAKFTGPTDFRGVTFDGRTEFRWVIFGGTTDFAGVPFGGNTTFAGATFGPKTDFREVIFDGNTTFAGAKFNGNTDFPGAQYTDFTGVQYTDFTGVIFGGITHFTLTTFDGMTHFTRATFDGDTDFRAATFDGDTDAWRATFDHDTTPARVDVTTFWGTTFDYDFTSARVKFTDFGRAKFNGGTDFRGAKFTSDTNFKEKEDQLPDRQTYDDRRITSTAPSFDGPSQFTQLPKFNNTVFSTCPTLYDGSDPRDFFSGAIFLDEQDGEE